LARSCGGGACFAQNPAAAIGATQQVGIEQFNNVQRERNQARNKVAELESRLRTQINQANQLSTDLASSNAGISQQNAQINQLKTKIADLERENRTLKQNLSIATNTASAANGNLQQERATAQTARNQLAVAETHAKALDTDLLELRNLTTELTNNLTAARKVIEEHAAEIKQLKLGNGRLAQDNRRLTGELSVANASLEDSNLKLQTQISIVSGLRGQLSVAKSKIEALKSEIWLWVGIAVVAALAVGAAASQKLWPPKPKLVELPVYASVALSNWSMAVVSPPAHHSTSFEVHVNWAPVRSKLSTAARLLADPPLAV
jgi:predicted nuclease with TOPRIM domain